MNWATATAASTALGLPKPDSSPKRRPRSEPVTVSSLVTTFRLTFSPLDRSCQTRSLLTCDPSFPAVAEMGRSSDAWITSRLNRWICSTDASSSQRMIVSKRSSVVWW